MLPGNGNFFFHLKVPNTPKFLGREIKNTSHSFAKIKNPAGTNFAEKSIKQNVFGRFLIYAKLWLPISFKKVFLMGNCRQGRPQRRGRPCLQCGHLIFFRPKLGFLLSKLQLDWWKDIFMSISIHKYWIWYFFPHIFLCWHMTGFKFPCTSLFHVKQKIVTREIFVLER